MEANRAPFVSVVAEAQGMRVVDLRSGLGFVVPDGVALLAGSAGPPAFDVSLRCASRPIEIRLRLDALPMRASPQMATMLCQTYARNRTAAAPQVGLAQPAQLQAWSVDAAASSIYPLRAPEDGFDYEECFYLLKGAQAQATVMTKRFASRHLTPQLWSDFNTRLNATLAWGVTRAASQPVASFFVDGNMTLTPAATAFAHDWAARLRAVGVPRAEVAEASQALRRVAYGSDPPDARIDPQLPNLLRMTVFGNVRSPAFREGLESLLKEKVVTYRDLRGMQIFLEGTAQLLG